MRMRRKPVWLLHGLQLTSRRELKTEGKTLPRHKDKELARGHHARGLNANTGTIANQKPLEGWLR